MIPDDDPLPAGSFPVWLTGMERALRGDAVADVPLRKLHGVLHLVAVHHIEPNEAATLAHIPAELLFPAPRQPRGHVLLGYDEEGHCPMLVDSACSIYQHRPRTCRTYDCRVFPATGVEVDDDGDKPDIARRARRWRLDHPSEADQVRHDAVRAAARFVRERADLLPEGVVASNPTQRAVLAIHLHQAFLGREDGTDRVVVTDPDPEAVRVVLTRREVPPPDEERRSSIPGP